MIALGFLLQVARPSIAASAQRVAVRLDFALRGVPNHGHLFRARVEHVLSQAPALRDDFSNPFVVWFNHPIGSSDSTLITLDNSSGRWRVSSLTGQGGPEPCRAAGCVGQDVGASL